jgi:hypothetical protein
MMHFMQRRLFTATLVACVCLTSSAASAINPCVPATTEQVYHSSTLVFTGEVSGYTPVNAAGETVAAEDAVGADYTVRVLEVFKGSAAKEQRVFVDRPPGAVAKSLANLLDVGKRYLLFASGERYRIDSCASSEMYHDIDVTLTELRQLRARNK